MIPHFSWNKWCLPCWFSPAWIQGLSEQWLGETSSPGAPGQGDPLFGVHGDCQGWTEQETQGLSALQGESPSSAPPEVPEAEGSISPKKPLYLPPPSICPLWKNTCVLCQNCITTPQTCVPKANPAHLNHHAVFLNGFTELKKTKQTCLKFGDTTVPDSSKFTALPPVSYLLSFSNNTLAAWQLSRAV